jgi:hypothetical protein
MAARLPGPAVRNDGRPLSFRAKRETSSDVEETARPLADFFDQGHDRISVKWLCVEQLLVAQRYGVDRQIIDPVGSGRSLDSGAGEEFEQWGQGMLQFEGDVVGRQDGLELFSIACCAWKPTVSSSISVLAASRRSAFSSPSAFLANTRARSRPSGLDKYPPRRQSLVEHRTLEVAPVIGVLATHEDHIETDTETAKLTA